LSYLLTLVQFSHRDVAHLAFNSIALFSFGSAAYYYLATPVPGQPVLPTTTHVAHYFAFFATAGVFAGLGSHLASNLVRLPRLIRALRSPAQLSPTHALAAHHALYPSLGASGAVYACLTMTALAYPDANISLIFLPMLAIPMPVGVLGMVAVDLFGIIRGWR
jgi:rhomboid-like protein